MMPWGSDVYASHITADMYKDFDQFFMAPVGAQPCVNSSTAKGDTGWYCDKGFKMGFYCNVN